jgi:hypothetical protein
MSHDTMDKKDVIDITPAQSHVHQEVAGMHDKALVTREPYGKSGTFILIANQVTGRHIEHWLTR